MIEQEISAKEVFAYVFKAVAQFKTVLFVIIFANILWAIDVSLRPYIIKIITNRIHELPASEVAKGLFMPACAYIALSFLMTTNFRMYNYFVQIKMIPELRKKIATSGFKSLLHQSHHFYQNNFAGSLASRINSLIDVVPDFWQLLIDRCFANGLCLCIAICTLWNVNLSFALAAIIWCIIFISTSFFFSSRLTKLSE